MASDEGVAGALFLTPIMPPCPRLTRIRAAFGRFRAVIFSASIGQNRNQTCLHISIASQVVRAALADAAHAEASVTELEKLEIRYSMLETAHLPSARARIERIESRVRKAQFHARSARDHADTAILIFLWCVETHFDSASGDLTRHADLAKQSRQLADELLEISLASERRERSRFSRQGRKLNPIW
ncbi:hypothetical protein WI42_05005 [Burkholderia ubonensis]|nr:hypothetical protein WI42_05005 [Burkholderia ubonensis]KVA29853.1 hypothetical protein WI43_03095 [Burkholderia ubonensis]KVA46817.1 hypothetical protein WI46_04840 [Burkholderia ubonensis]